MRKRKIVMKRGEPDREARPLIRDAGGALVPLEVLHGQEGILSLRRRLPVLGGPDLVVGDSTIPGAGRGLFAGRAFAAGELITFYDGPVIAHTPRLPARYRTHARALFPLRYTILGNHEAARLGEPGTGAGALVNHAATNPNVDFLPVDSAENEEAIATFADLATDLSPWERIMTLVALRDISAGDEFLVYYGRDYWTRADAPADQGIEPVLMRPEDWTGRGSTRPPAKKRRVTLTPLSCACVPRYVDLVKRQCVCHMHPFI